MGYGVVKKRLHWGASLSLAIYGILFYLFAEVSESADALQVRARVSPHQRLPACSPPDNTITRTRRRCRSTPS
jgi:hypothetical protein